MYQVVRFLALVPLVFFFVFYGALGVTVLPVVALAVLLLLSGLLVENPSPGTSSGSERCGDLGDAVCEWLHVPVDQVMTPGELIVRAWERTGEMLGMSLWLFLLLQLVIPFVSWLTYREAGRRQRVRVGALALERLYDAEGSYASSVKVAQQ